MSPCSGVAPTIMTTRQNILLAHGVLEYAVAVDHLRALQSVNVHVPVQTLNEVERTLLHLLWFWCYRTGQTLAPDDPVPIINTVRSYLREHIEELDALLNE